MKLNDRFQVTCVCGWETKGDQAAVVEATQAHGRDVHNMDTTVDQVMAMASLIER